jgi:hypothetical protein
MAKTIFVYKRSYLDWGVYPAIRADPQKIFQTMFANLFANKKTKELHANATPLLTGSPNS